MSITFTRDPINAKAVDAFHVLFKGSIGEKFSEEIKIDPKVVRQTMGHIKLYAHQSLLNSITV